MGRLTHTTESLSSGPIVPARHARSLLSLAVFLGVGLLAYAPVLRGSFFTDDWVFALESPRSHVLGSFQELHPFTKYRPLQTFVVAVSQTLFGQNTLPVHVLQIVLHALVALLVYRVLLRLGVSLLGAYTGALLMLVSQGAVASVGGNDTLSMTLSTAAGGVSLWWIYSASGGGGWGRLLAAAAALAVALLSKESALAYLPLLCLLAWGRQGSTRTGTGRKPVVAAGLFCLIGLLYLLARRELHAASPSFHSSGYYQQHPDFRWGYMLGGNLFKNPVLLWLSAILPVSSLEFFDGVRLRHWLWPVVGLVGTGGLCTLCIWGLSKARRLRWGIVWIGAGTVVLIPVILLWHVSELYSYAVLPFFSVVVGLSAGALLDHEPSLVRRSGLIAFVLFILFSNGWATWAKARGMAENGRLAGLLVERLVPWVKSMPSGGRLVLVDPPAARPDYSVFRVRGFYLLDDGAILKRLSGREDVAIRMTKKAPEAGEDTVLTLAPDFSVVPLRVPAGER